MQERREAKKLRGGARQQLPFQVDRQKARAYVNLCIPFIAKII